MNPKKRSNLSLSRESIETMSREYIPSNAIGTDVTILMDARNGIRLCTLQHPWSSIANSEYSTFDALKLAVIYDFIL